ncbi:MAG: prepilin-type N-terminal cleavage/methylation domain-containing protein [Angelakisella sp.]
MKPKSNQKGFTLVEIIVVLVIIAVLAVIALPALTGYIERANISKAEMAFGDMRKAMTAAAAHVEVPNIGDGLDIFSNSDNHMDDNNDEKVFAEKVQLYLRDYEMQSGASKFKIITEFSSARDKDTANLVESSTLIFYPKGYVAGEGYYQYQDGVITAVGF